jgi:hypothetical protein
MAVGMSSADLIHRNGFGAALWQSRKAFIAASSSSTHAAPDLLFGEQCEEAFHLVQ